MAEGVSVAVGEMRDPIKFQATIAKVQTLADGGIRVTLDLPETAILQAAHLMEVRRQMAVVDASLTPVIPTLETDNAGKASKSKF